MTRRRQGRSALRRPASPLATGSREQVWCAFSVPDSTSFSVTHRENDPHKDAHNAFSFPV